MEFPREIVLDDGPEWRWNRVTQIVEQDRTPPRRMSDAMIRRACNYLRRYHRLREMEDQVWLQGDYPDLFGAHRMYENPESEKWIIEAGILAKQDDVFLAQYIASKPEVIKAYADYFFDVRSRLNSPGFIINRVLRPAAQRGAAVDENEMMIKMAAWTGGWNLVQETLDSRHLSVDSLNWLKTAFIHELVKKGWMATRRVDVNNFTAMDIINSVLRVAELEHEAKKTKLIHKDEKAQTNEVLAGLQGLLNQMQTGTLRPDKVIGPEKRSMVLEESHGKDG